MVNLRNTVRNIDSFNEYYLYMNHCKSTVIMIFLGSDQSIPITTLIIIQFTAKV